MLMVRTYCNANTIYCLHDLGDQQCAKSPRVDSNEFRLMGWMPDSLPLLDSQAPWVGSLLKDVWPRARGDVKTSLTRAANLSLLPDASHRRSDSQVQMGQTPGATPLLNSSACQASTANANDRQQSRAPPSQCN